MLPETGATSAGSVTCRCGRRFHSTLPGDGRTVVAGGDQLLEAEIVETGGEVLEEIALEGVVAVAIDDLPAKGVGVELQVRRHLLLDIVILGIKLVLLGRPRGPKPLIHRLVFRLRHGLNGQTLADEWFPHPRPRHDARTELPDGY